MALANTILITGSNGGLGTEIVSYLLKNGVRNIACHFRKSKKEIEDVLIAGDLDPSKHLYYADLTSENDISSMRKEIEQNLGIVNTLFNLAGGSCNGFLWKTTKKSFNEVIESNLLSTFLCSREFIPCMRTLGHGTIINTSSVVGSTGVAGASIYSAAKAAINALTKSMSIELANKNITVNSLALGYFDRGIINHIPKEIQEKICEQIPLKRFGKSSEIEAIVKYLMSEEARYITGQTFHINGGLYK